MIMASRGPSDEPEASPPTEPVVQQGVAREEFDEVKEIMRSLQSGINTLSTSFSAVVADRGARGEATDAASIAPRNPYAEVTNEQLQDAADSGDYARLMRLQNQQMLRMNWDQEQRFNARLEALSTTGIGAIAEIRQDMIGAKLPYYERFKKEIDQYVNSLPADQRIRPEVYTIAHNIVVGGHMQEILQEDRTARAPTGQVNTPGARGRQTIETTPQAEVQLDEDALDELNYKGVDPDSFSRKLGYKSWKDYMQRTGGAA